MVWCTYLGNRPRLIANHPALYGLESNWLKMGEDPRACWKSNRHGTVRSDRDRLARVEPTVTVRPTRIRWSTYAFMYFVLGTKRQVARKELQLPSEGLAR